MDRFPSQSEFYGDKEQLDNREKELDPNIFSKNLKGNRLQLIEKLDIGRIQDEDSDTNIVNGLDDSLLQDQINSNFNTHNPKSPNLPTSSKLKSRNFKGLGKRLKLKGLKTTSNLKENI